MRARTDRVKWDLPAHAPAHAASVLIHQSTAQSRQPGDRRNASTTVRGLPLPAAPCPARFPGRGRPGNRRMRGSPSHRLPALAAGAAAPGKRQHLLSKLQPGTVGARLHRAHRNGEHRSDLFDESPWTSLRTMISRLSRVRLRTACQKSALRPPRCRAYSGSVYAEASASSSSSLESDAKGRTCALRKRSMQTFLAVRIIQGMKPASSGQAWRFS